jgi:putative membrane protein
MRRLGMFVAMTMLLALPLAGYAQQPAGSGKLPAGDEKFVKQVAIGSKAEVELGRLASERGGSDAVKQFGQRMVTDHGKASEELAQLAQQKGVTLPADLDAQHKKLYDRLAKLSGAKFDAAYAREMLRDHDKDVKEFEREAQRAKDPDVKAWAGKTLPTLKEHQQAARQLVASVKAAGSPAAAK